MRAPSNNIRSYVSPLPHVVDIWQGDNMRFHVNIDDLNNN